MRVGAPVEHGGLSRNSICAVLDSVVERNEGSMRAQKATQVN